MAIVSAFCRAERDFGAVLFSSGASFIFISLQIRVEVSYLLNRDIFRPRNGSWSRTSGYPGLSRQD
jgi:hypothetical protein